MEKQNKHMTPRFERFLAYFRDLLSSKEKHDFEKELMRDPFADEAFEGLSRFSPEEMERDIAALQEKIAAKTERKSIRFLPIVRYGVAAILLLTLGTTVFLIRQSVQKAPELSKLAETIDSMPTPRKAFTKNEDSLKQPIAYTTSGAQKEKDAAETYRSRTVTDNEAPLSRAAKRDLAIAETEQERILPRALEVEEVQAETERKYTLREQEDLSSALSGRVAGVEITRETEPKRSKSASPAKELNVVPYENEQSGDLRTISGWVVSADDGEPIPGVNVTLKGTTQGTVTDIQGNFVMNVPADKENVLAFSFVGYETEEMKVKGDEDIRLALNEDMMSLDEVVVVGYGTTRKTELTGAVSTVRSEELNAQPAAPSVIIKPQPSVSTRAFKDYIQENIRYDQLPKLDKSLVVKLDFTVSEKGEILHVKVDKSAGDAFDEEAVRLLMEGPAWLPGSVNGVPVQEKVIVKIKFEPQGKE